MQVLIQIFRAIWEPFREYAWKPFRDHAREDWPAALVVTAIVTIVHMNLGWFDAIDRFAYVVLGHISSLTRSPEATDTVRIAIDEKTQAERYLDRSPLDRCVLKEHLASIYEADPRLVVVDLDVSPALWIEQSASIEKDNQKTCEDDLYKRIQEHGKKTILMLPFAILKSELEANTLGKQREWMSSMHKKGVRFGRGELLVEHGIVNEASMSPCSLSRVALQPVAISEEKCNTEIDGSVAKVLCACQSQKQKVRRIVLNFRKEIKLVELSEPGSASLKETQGKVVFFGARYGEQDRFLTLRDEMYGMDLHALGYASGINGQGIDFLDDQVGHILKFVIELAIAFVFGTLITYIWRRYFELHRSESKSKQESAFLQVLWLGLWFFVLLYGCLVGSLFLLTRSGVWLSPVPIAIGMLIESFAVGSVMEALRRGPASEAIGSPLVTTQVTERVDQGLSVVIQIATVPVSTLPKSGPINDEKSLKNFFWYDWRDDLRGFEPPPGLMILLRRLMWSAVVGYAVWLIVMEH